MERIEKFGEKWWGMLILISIPVFIVLSPVLVGGYNFLDPTNERLQQGFFFYKDAILRGDSIFWNPYLFSGFPTFASVNVGFFDPLIYIAMKFFPVISVYNWFKFLYFVLTGFFTTLLLKKFNVSFWGRYTGGIIFLFSQWPRTYDVTTDYSFFLLPLLFLLLLEIKESTGWRYLSFILIGVISIGLGWFSSFWHFLIEVLFAVGIFALFLAFIDFYRDKKGVAQNALRLLRIHFRKYIKIPVAYFLMVLGGTFIGLIQLVPTLLFIKLSSRAEQFTHLEAIQGGFRLQDIIGFFMPYFNYPFSALSSHYVGYFGILPLFLFIVAFALRRSTAYIVFFSFLALLGVILAINSSPLFWLLHHFPVINLLQTASRWMLLASFGVAILAGFGLDMISEKFEILRSRLKLKVISWVFLLIILLIIPIILATHTNFDFFDPKFIIPFLFLIVSYIFIRFYIAGKFKPRQFVALIALIIALNFTAVFSFNDNIARKSILDKEPLTVKFLRKQEEGRIFSFFRFVSLWRLGHTDNTQEKLVLKSELLFPNKNVPFKIESVDYEGDPMVNKSMSRLVGYIGGAASPPRAEKLENLLLPDEEKINLFKSRKPIMDFLNIKYLLSSVQPVWFPDNTFSFIFYIRETPKEVPVFIYKNNQARPLYYFTNEEWLVDLDNNTTPEAFNQKLKESDGKITQEGVNLVERKNALLVLKTDIKNPQLLVFSQNNLPGWKAHIDGEEALIYNIGTVYMGVLVPAGQHQVVFKYSYWEIWRQFFNNIL